MLRVIRFVGVRSFPKRRTFSSNTTLKPAENVFGVKQPTTERKTLNNEDAQLALYITQMSKTVEQEVQEADDLETLLSLCTRSNLRKKDAVSIITTLSKWNASKKIELSDFQNDERYLQVCQFLGKQLHADETGSESGKTYGLHKFLSELPKAKLISLLLSQAAGQHRVGPLLWEMMDCLTKNEEPLKFQDSQNILYVMAKMRLLHDGCLEKITRNIVQSTEVPQIPVLHSIAKSLGLLQCRNIELMSRLIKLYQNQINITKKQNILQLVMACAMIDYKPEELEEIIRVSTPLFGATDPPSIILPWVWSLSLLNNPDSRAIQFVLSPYFSSQISEFSSNVRTSQMQLLNINAFASLLLKDYDGPFLTETSMPFNIPSQNPLDVAMLETLEHMYGLSNVKSNVDTGAGFLTAAEFKMNDDLKPIPDSSKEGHQVAFMTVDYNSTCFGDRSKPVGVKVFHERILNAKGYNVVKLMYGQFHYNALLTDRMKYIEFKLKEIPCKSK